MIKSFILTEKYFFSFWLDFLKSFLISVESFFSEITTYH